MVDTFLRDVLNGLSKTPKVLPSKYFYDDRGSELFQMIMRLPEYYLTKAEYEILDTQSGQIFKDFHPNSNFDIIEFGAGDGSKTKLLLREFLSFTNEFDYIPVDISSAALNGLEADYKQELAELRVKVINDDYFSALEGLKRKGTTKLVLFLGSNIGNFKDKGEIDFLQSMRAKLNDGDYALIGFDLRKDPKLILDAYNDSAGVTREFNLNLLRRINSELGADFSIPNFSHYPTYNPITGETRSYLISLSEQLVHIGSSEVHFDYAEPIFMEVSKKYTLGEITELSQKTGFEVVSNYYDCKGYFLDSLWRAA